MARRITPILVTHFSPKSSYGSFAPPETTLIKTAIESARDRLRGFDIESTPPLVYYNRPIKPTNESRTYRENLQNLSEDLDFCLEELPNYGLKNALTRALDRVDTPYTLFIEHDWKFVENVDLKSLLDLFDADDEVNYVRFNKRTNLEEGYDTIVKEDDSKPISVCRVSSYSNNPHVVRTSQYKTWLAKSEPTFRTVLQGVRRNTDIGGYGIRTTFRVLKNKYLLQKNHVRQFDGVEFVLDTKFKRQIRTQGFEAAHEQWGTYLYGGKGEGPYVTHMDDQI